MKKTRKPVATVLAAVTAFLFANSACLAGELFTQEGTDPSFAELLEKGTLKAGERFFKGNVQGSRIIVNKELLEKQAGELPPIPKNIGIHTQASGGIKRKDFPNWTRWYQEDGNVQVFRLFKGEQNIRSGTGDRASQGRIEAYSQGLKAGPDTWCEWQGTYTIIKPVGACIFQLMHEGSLWPMHIDMDVQGNIHFLYRRPVAGQPRKIIIAENMAGKSISIKVRGNGTDYEVFQKNPIGEGDWEPVAKGSYTPAEDDKISFRWGMYVGSKKGHSVPGDGLLLVTGVSFR